MAGTDLGGAGATGSYVKRPKIESTMTPAAQPVDVWLRSNPRPALFALVAVGLSSCLLLGGVRAAGVGPRGVGVAALVAVLAVAGGGAMLAAASLPRLERRGAMLRIRLAPFIGHDVPLEVVECVFPGSQPLADGPPGDAVRRVGTVIVRFAERAVEWRRRPAFPAWGTWQDGQVVIDGRWCEPLSLAVTQRLGQRILEAKREVALSTAQPEADAP